MWTKHAVDGYVRRMLYCLAVMALGVALAFAISALASGCSHGTPRARVPVGQPTALMAATVAPAEPGWSDAECLRLMEERDGWQFAAVFLAGIGGAGGITTAAVPSDDPNNWPKWTTGTIAAVSGAAGAAAVLVAKSKAESFETYCAVDEPVRAPVATKPDDPTATLGLPKPGTNPKRENETADAGK